MAHRRPAVRQAPLAKNTQQSYSGRKAVLVSGFAALLIGAGPAIVNFFFSTGQGVH